MTLLELAASIVVIVGGALLLATLTIVGRRRLARLRTQFRARMQTIAPYLLLLGFVLAINALTRKFTPEVSWLIGWNITTAIFNIEGSFVAWLQAAVPAWMTGFFAFMYIYGYVFLLVFPLVAYFALAELRFLRETCLAYTLNYGIGLVCYITFVAYGPRNLMPDMVESLLYVHWPGSHLLTSQVNTRTNVFPSLHSSLSLTVLFLAYRTRDRYPAWFVVASVVSLSITASTMVLGIHWLLDVVAGGALAFAAVWGAIWLDGRSGAEGRLRAIEGRAVARVGRYLRTIREVMRVRR